MEVERMKEVWPWEAWRNFAREASWSFVARVERRLVSRRRRRKEVLPDRRVVSWWAVKWERINIPPLQPATSKLNSGLVLGSTAEDKEGCG